MLAYYSQIAFFSLAKMFVAGLIPASTSDWSKVAFTVWGRNLNAQKRDKT